MINLPAAPRVNVSEDGTVRVEIGATVMVFVPLPDGSWQVIRDSAPVGDVIATPEGGLAVRDLDGRVLTSFAAADVLAAQGRIDQLLAARGG